MIGPCCDKKNSLHAHFSLLIYFRIEIKILIFSEHMQPHLGRIKFTHINFKDAIVNGWHTSHYIIQATRHHLKKGGADRPWGEGQLNIEHLNI